MKQEDPSFERLWQLWRPYKRKTDGRGKARPTYLRWLADGADPADIYDGAAYHLRTMAEKDRPYINLLSVYLNSEDWVDGCKDERAYQQRMAEREAKTNVVPITTAPKSKFLQHWERRQVGVE